jgi:hypothetical protein
MDCATGGGTPPLAMWPVGWVDMIALVAAVEFNFGVSL